MNVETTYRTVLEYILLVGPDEALKRLKGVQGPERSLVGESRSARKQDGAEERKEQSDCSEEGRRVGEIVELAELRRHLDRKIYEAQRYVTRSLSSGLDMSYTIAKAREAALIELRSDFKRIAEKRSDLSNADGDARRETHPNQLDG
jgi:hypothetical protein